MTGLAGMVMAFLLFGSVPGWREDFNDTRKWQRVPPDRNWRYDGGKFAVPNTRFYVKDGALVVEAERSSGSMMTMPRVDVKKYPVLRWRWRVRNLPPKADGRNPLLDDQAAVLYIGSGGIFNRKVVAFRWETETPIGYCGKTDYAGGIVSVHFHCLRNRTSPVNEWVEESVNVAEIFQKTYGFLPGPEEYVITFGGNSQYTHSHTFADFDFVELGKEETTDKGVQK
ncbi:MAG: DUF3047 domain-containing protein [Lentisphaeria bacterium]|nr:DUF3047 domain-containing protein [Lentisphaeria bacterium]